MEHTPKHIATQQVNALNQTRAEGSTQGGGKLDGKGKARNIRRKEIYPRVKPLNAFRLSETFRADVLEFAQGDLALFRHNCKFIAYVKRIPFTHLMRELNAQGVRISRETIVGKSIIKHTFPKSLLLSTFAYALGVPTWLLLSPNVESDCERLKII